MNENILTVKNQSQRRNHGPYFFYAVETGDLLLTSVSVSFHTGTLVSASLVPIPSCLISSPENGPHLL